MMHDPSEHSPLIHLVGAVNPLAGNSLFLLCLNGH